MVNSEKTPSFYHMLSERDLLDLIGETFIEYDVTGLIDAAAEPLGGDDYQACVIAKGILTECINRWKELRSEGHDNG